MRKSYAKSTNVHSPLTLDVDDNGLRFQGQTFASEVSWDHFARFYEDEKSFVISQRGQIVFKHPPEALSFTRTDLKLARPTQPAHKHTMKLTEACHSHGGQHHRKMRENL